MKHFEVLIASGPNLDLLGKREPEHYGNSTLNDIHANLLKITDTITKQNNIHLQLHFLQTNCESELLNKLTEKIWNGIVINPAAWTHTSIALADRLKAIAIPFVEIHLSNISAREDYRKKSYLAPLAAGIVYGFGPLSYSIALEGLIKHLLENCNP